MLVGGGGGGEYFPVFNLGMNAMYPMYNPRIYFMLTQLTLCKWYVGHF